MSTEIRKQPAECDCLLWGNDGLLLMGLHHKYCDYAPHDNPRLIRALIESLLDAMDDWASDEDGIHPDAWEAYKACCLAVGRKIGASA